MNGILEWQIAMYIALGTICIMATVFIVYIGKCIYKSVLKKCSVPKIKLQKMIVIRCIPKRSIYVERISMQRLKRGMHWEIQVWNNR